MTIARISGCIGCGVCVKTCPTDVIRMDRKPERPSFKYPADCQICHLCRMYCPVDAITITPDKSIPVIVSWGWIMNTPNKPGFTSMVVLTFLAAPTPLSRAWSTRHKEPGSRIFSRC